MIEKPEIDEEKLVAALNQSYSIQANHIEFLPVGNDASAFAYRVGTKQGNSYFLKVKTRLLNPAGLLVPRFLKDHGVDQVVAPLPSKAQKLFEEMDGLHLILYPFLTGQEAMEVGLSDLQWQEFGSVLKRIHRSKLPTRISQVVQREEFLPKWSSIGKELHKQVNTRNYADPDQRELAAFWKEKNETIQTLIMQAERMGALLQKSHLEFVLCHADIHTANILLTARQEMFIVDWDDTLFAPRDRDLMFVVGEATHQTREEQNFFQGYGAVNIDPLALAYYRYEWCVQEIGDFGQRVLMTQGSGKSTKQDAVQGFIKLFSQGEVVEAALRTPYEFEIRRHPG